MLELIWIKKYVFIHTPRGCFSFQNGNFFYEHLLEASVLIIIQNQYCKECRLQSWEPCFKNFSSKSAQWYWKLYKASFFFFSIKSDCWIQIQFKSYSTIFFVKKLLLWKSLVRHFNVASCSSKDIPDEFTMWVTLGCALADSISGSSG